MQTVDWVVVGVYAALIVGVAAWFTRRAGRSAEDYVVAGRKLPWWVIGFSNVASADGGDAFWVLIVFSGAFIGLFRFFWLSAIFALPLAVLWARYWRRLRLVSAGELYEVRYGGTAAGRFRAFFVVYSALTGTGVVLAYVLQACAQILAPFFGWTPGLTLAVVCLSSAAYTMASGLLGVAYSDVPQFLFAMAGRVLLAVVLVGACGGMVEMLDGVVAARGAEFLQPFPPASGPLFGAWSVEEGTFVALALAGLFSVAGTKSVTVQRSLAARSEGDAALGTLVDLVMTLGVRVAPLVVIGLAAVALMPDAEPSEQVWTELVKTHAGPGLLGLILAGIVAGYMSTVDTYLNFMTAGLYNDLYRRHLRPQAGPREQVWFCRAATLFSTGVAFLWATFLIGAIDADWLNFINSVLGLFVLPLALLRWVWWRVNIWSEVAALVLGVPLAYVVWFPLGLKDEPYWKAFLILFFAGWGVILAVTLLTRPEKAETLRAFYLKVRPPGFWGPVVAGLSAVDRAATQGAWRNDLLLAGAGFGLCVGVTVGMGAGFARSWGLLAGMVVLLAVSTVGMVVSLRRGALGRES